MPNCDFDAMLKSIDKLDIPADSMALPPVPFSTEGEWWFGSLVVSATREQYTPLGIAIWTLEGTLQHFENRLGDPFDARPADPQVG